MRMTIVRSIGVVLVTVVAALTGLAQEAAPVITSQDLLNGLKDPGRWLMFGGNYSGQRHSPLAQITPDNVSRLQPQWVFQTETLGRFDYFSASTSAETRSIARSFHACSIVARAIKPPASPLPPLTKMC